VFVAALAVGVYSGLVAALLRRSPLVFIVPGVLMIVPGSAGFDTVLRLLTGQIVSGIDAGVDALVTAMSIAYDSWSRVADSGEHRLGPARVRR
jgi:uncharacterized membrane protein YjjB (DUF3815 family)